MTPTITPTRLRDMRTLLDAAPVRYSGVAADCCDAAADLIETKQAEIERLTVVNSAYVDLAGELIRATGKDNIIDALNAAVEHLEAAQ